MILTKQQRHALKRVYDRLPLVTEADMVGDNVMRRAIVAEPGDTPITYRQFRKLVHYGHGCIMVPWCGMWLGIERDGYTHS